MAESIADAKTFLTGAAGACYLGYRGLLPAIQDEAYDALADYSTDAPEPGLVGALADSINFTLGNYTDGDPFTMLRQAISRLAIVGGFIPGNAQQMFDFLETWLDDLGPHAGGSVDSYLAARGITRGSLPSITNLLLYRLTVSKWGHAIQNGAVESKLISVVTPTNAVQKLINFSGEERPLTLNDSETGGSGINTNITMLDGQSSRPPSLQFGGGAAVNTVQNAGFALGLPNNTALAAGSTYSGWTIEAGTTWTYRTDTAVWRDGFRSRTSVRTTGDGRISTPILNVLSPDQPHVAGVWVKVTSAGTDHTITLTWGSDSQVFSSVTAGSWQFLAIDRDADCWPENFQGSATDRLKIEVDINSATQVDICYADLIPMTLVDGTWYLAVSGDTTPAQYAAGTLTDTFTTGTAFTGRIMQMLILAYPGVQVALPVAGSNIIADPSWDAAYFIALAAKYGVTVT